MLKRSIIIFLLLIVSFTISPYYLAAEEPGGIGLSILQLYHHEREDHKGPIVVIDVLPNGPALPAGVERGDIITHIDGRLVAGNDFFYILEEMLRGEAYTNITLTIQRARTKQNFNLSLERVKTKGLY
jgi:C-terminal processing protease CtpA/Prc